MFKVIFVSVSMGANLLLLWSKNSKYLKTISLFLSVSLETNVLLKSNVKET